MQHDKYGGMQVFFVFTFTNRNIAYVPRPLKGVITTSKSTRRSFTLGILLHAKAPSGYARPSDPIPHLSAKWDLEDEIGFPIRG